MKSDSEFTFPYGIVLSVKKKILFGIPHMEVKKIGDSMIIYIGIMNRKKNSVKN
ncbi:MAG: hypothetical protein ACFFAQ_04205 [Promethearchaeota archaeon]